MQHDTADQLHVVGTQADRALRGLAHQREGLDQRLIRLAALLHPLAQGVRSRAQTGLVQRLQLRLQRVDALYGVLVTL